LAHVAGHAIPGTMRVLFMVSIALQAVGCFTVSKSGDRVQPDSQANARLQTRLPTIVAGLLRGENWTGKIVEQSQEGHVAQNSGETWNGSLFVFDIETVDSQNKTILLETESYHTFLKAIRGKLRDAIEDEQGTQLDYTFANTYKERTLEFFYQVEKTVGQIRVTMQPTRDHVDELRTRIQILIVERPLPE